MAAVEEKSMVPTVLVGVGGLGQKYYQEYAD